jgi:hypothetical protein
MANQELNGHKHAKMFFEKVPGMSKCPAGGEGSFVILFLLVGYAAAGGG